LERATKGLVIDASVAAKWFIPEEDSDKASKILQEYADGKIELYAPDLLIYEVINVMRYRPDIDEEALANNVDSLFKLQLNLIPPSPDITSEAAAKAKLFNLSVYDACYIAIAEALSANLITADEKLYAKSKGNAFFLKELNEKWKLL
jgi:predicted nucleic acid-binding protein